MTRATFDAELQRLEDELLALGSSVQYALADAVKSLVTRDFEESKRIKASDWQINARNHEIEQGCVMLIATQQPLAGDLRVLTSMIAISAELERIGDYAKGIAKINLLIGEEELMKPLIDIPRMATQTQDMLHRSLIAFSKRDLDMATTIPREDDEIDNLYDQIYRELFTYMLKDPAYINQGNYLLWVAHNIERTADRVNNICERVIYMITGQLVEMDNVTDDELDLPTNPKDVEPIEKKM